METLITQGMILHIDLRFFDCTAIHKTTRIRKFLKYILHTATTIPPGKWRESWLSRMIEDNDTNQSTSWIFINMDKIAMDIQTDT